MGETPRSQQRPVVITFVTDEALLPPMWDEIGGVILDEVDFDPINENTPVNTGLFNITASVTAGTGKN